MKDLLIGMGLGFVVGAITCKCNKPVADTVQKGKEIITDVAEEIKTQTKKSKQQENN